MIDVEVAFARPDRQWLMAVQVPEGATVAEAIERSGITDAVEGLVVDPERVGVFGRKRSMEDVLRPGDRVEIYRPLECDPKEVRRQRARQSGD